MLPCRGFALSGIFALAAVPLAPASALTAVYAQAGATGATSGTYSLGVTYYSPTGLSVTSSGPTNGTTSSYMPISASPGLTAISLSAAVNGNSSGTATASADLSAGTVKATATSDTYLAVGSARAELYDDVTFTVTGGGSKQITVISHLDGAIGSFANAFSFSGLGYILNFGTTSNLVYTSQGTQSGFTVTAGGASSLTPVGWDSYSLTNVTGSGFDFTGILTITDGEVRSVGQRLSLTCQEGVNCDFSHTGSIALQLPAGVSFSSGSGVFLAPPVVGGVPEPASWAMLIAGFGLVGGIARQRRLRNRAMTAVVRA